MIRLSSAAGRVALAITIVGASLGWHAPANAQSTDSIPTDSLRARAAVAWSENRQDEALRLYDELLTRDSSPEPLQRLAALLARAGRLDESIAAYRRYTNRNPADVEGRVALARTLAWSARYDQALGVYEAVLAERPTFGPAVLGAAQTLAWAGRYDAAAARYRSWIAANPGDTEARLALARTYAWAGRYDDAEALYRELATSAGGNREAERGLARVTAWRGDLASSEYQWRALAASDTTDVETLTGLAQVLRWRGRPAEAEIALRRALRVDPDHGDARSQLPWVLADLRASLAPSVDYVSDSDRNRVQTYTLAGTRPHVVPGLSLRGSLSHREASLGTGAAASRGISSGARAAIFWRRPGSSVFVDGGIGIVRLSADTSNGASQRAVRIRPAIVLAAGGRPTRAIGISLTASRAPFDETAPLIARGIGVDVVSADVDASITPRLSAAGSAEAARITGGGVGNRRLGGAASVRWNGDRRVSLAVAARAFGYDTTVAEGYFSPRAYRMAEGSARVQLGREPGWSGVMEGGIGAQYLDFRGAESTRMLQRIRGTVTYRHMPGREAFATAGYANGAAPGQLERDEYRAVTFTVGSRLRF